MKKIISSLLVCLSILVFTGCGSTGKFVYPAKMSSLIQIDSEPVLNKRVAVLPFDDYRSDENSCWFPLYLIPLMPFSWGDYERPDAASMFLSIVKYDITPSEDLAKATAVSLRHSNIFQDTFFTMGGEKQNADFILTGRIKMLKYKGKMFTYCLSVYGPIFWIFGAPAGMSENRIALELQLKNKQGKVLWDWAIDKEEWIVQWLYARMGHDCKMFAQMYQDGMNDAMNNLAKRIRERPDLFK
jgi:hypothetical protein